MKKTLRTLIFILAIALIVSLLGVVLTGCAQTEKLYLFNYGDYISPEVYELFEQEYGITVVVDEYGAPEDMYAKFVLGTAKYDLICSSDYMIEKLIAEGYLSELDYSAIPNFSNIDENQITSLKSFDTELKYTVPHFWGTVGLLYNTELVSEEDVKDWDVLFNGKYAGQIIMPNSERDAMFVALKHLGYDGNTTVKSELDAAAALLQAQKKDVQAYLLDEAARVKVEAENAAIAVIYNGEAYLAFENNDKLDFVVPESGTCIWMDAFAVPKDAQSKGNAELFLNFLCREDIAKINFEYIYYSTPNKAVKASLDEEVLSERAIFPADSVYENATVFKYLGKATEEYYATLWKEIKSS